MKPQRTHTSIATVLGLAILLSSCTSGTTQQPSPIGGVTYKPSFLPIKITYDFFSKAISVSFSDEIQTPLGTFGYVLGAKIAEKKFESVRKLKIQAGDKLYVYKLERGTSYSIAIPTDENGKTEISYTGTDDDVTITIPNPTSDTVADLKARLKEEQEARQRAEDELHSQSDGQRNNLQSGDDSAPQFVTPTPALLPTPPPDLVLQQTRGRSGIYTDGVSEVRINAVIPTQFDFVISTPRCSREAHGSARWRTENLAYSLSSISEVAAGMTNALPLESMCHLSFEFSAGVLRVGDGTGDCHCHYTGVYSLK